MDDTPPQARVKHGLLKPILNSRMSLNWIEVPNGAGMV